MEFVLQSTETTMKNDSNNRKQCGGEIKYIYTNNPDFTMYSIISLMQKHFTTA